jgi:hypothetical protein
MKLISMTDFVLEQMALHDDKKALDKIEDYAYFLKQPLKKSMFVPCDEDDNILEEPEQFKHWLSSDHYYNASESVCHLCRMYQKAKERVIFDYFNLEEFKYGLDFKDITIEDLVPYNLTIKNILI